MLNPRLNVYILIVLDIYTQDIVALPTSALKSGPVENVILYRRMNAFMHFWAAMLYFMVVMWTHSAVITN